LFVLNNDLVYEESEKPFLARDELDVSVERMNENLFRDTLYFVTNV
jgi:hypothetical protein